MSSFCPRSYVSLPYKNRANLFFKGVCVHEHLAQSLQAQGKRLSLKIFCPEGRTFARKVNQPFRL